MNGRSQVPHALLAPAWGGGSRNGGIMPAHTQAVLTEPRMSSPSFNSL